MNTRTEFFQQLVERIADQERAKGCVLIIFHSDGLAEMVHGCRPEFAAQMPEKLRKACDQAEQQISATDRAVN